MGENRRRFAIQPQNSAAARHTARLSNRLSWCIGGSRLEIRSGQAAWDHIAAFMAIRQVAIPEVTRLPSQAATRSPPSGSRKAIQSHPKACERSEEHTS